MQIRTVGGLMVILAVAAAQSVWAAGIDVTEWRLLTSVSVGNGNIADGTTTVTNPLMADYSTGLSNSTAFSSISASWDTRGFLEFLVEGEHANEENSFFSFARSTGSIFFTPAVDSVVAITGEYNYMLGAGFRDAVLGVSVSQVGGGSPPLRDYQFRSTLVDPPTGQMTHQSEGTVVFAGVDYALTYQLSVNSTTGSPTNLSHGNGFVRFNISPVPEPTTALLLIFSGGSMVGWRRR